MLLCVFVFMNILIYTCSSTCAYLKLIDIYFGHLFSVQLEAPIELGVPSDRLPLPNEKSTLANYSKTTQYECTNLLLCVLILLDKAFYYKNRKQQQSLACYGGLRDISKARLA